MGTSGKWGLFLKVLPLTGLFAAAKLAVHNLHLEPWEFDSLTGSLFGASTFVLAFVLSGTLASYNASEDMLAQFVNAIEAIADLNRYVQRQQAGHDAGAVQRHLGAMLIGLKDWLQNRLSLDRLEEALQQLGDELARMRQSSGDSVCDRGLPELAKLRHLISKMAANRDSEFLGPAYALLEIFLVGAVLALLLIGADRFSENMVVSCFLFTSFSYLLLLIRDLDNPFQYDGSSCVDVNLAPLLQCHERLLGPEIAAADAGAAADSNVAANPP